MKKPIEQHKPLLHPRNKNNSRYDFTLLTERYPELSPLLFVNRHGRRTLNFADPAAVRTLNRILLHHHYGIRFWDIPQQYLCPPIPGRADYLHYVADLLSRSNGDQIPTGPTVSILDIGVGANCIFPLIGSAEYGWSFVGSDIDPDAVSSARSIVDNNGWSDRVEVRLQENPSSIFSGIIRPNERFFLTLCNPPFHSSLQQALSGTRRKWKNLGHTGRPSSTLNFGGRHHELVTPGGEETFIRKMIEESITFSAQVLWFSTMVSRRSLVPSVTEFVHHNSAKEVQVIEMAQGQKQSRIVAWTFVEEADRRQWISSHRKESE